MTQFEFFMSFYSLLLGLAVAELMSGFGNLIRAHRQPDWGILTPLAGIDLFISIIASFADAWEKLQRVTIGFSGIAVPSLIGVSYFVAAVMVTPRQVESWPSLDVYYRARGRLSIAALITVELLTIIFLEIASGRVAGFSRAGQIAYGVINVTMVGLLAIAALAPGRRLVAVALILYGAIGVSLYAAPVTIDSWSCKATALLAPSASQSACAAHNGNQATAARPPRRSAA